MLHFQEEDIKNFRLKLQQIHRPSCVAIEKDLRKMNMNARVNDSMLGKVSQSNTPIPHRPRIPQIDKYLDSWLNRTQFVMVLTDSHSP